MGVQPDNLIEIWSGANRDILATHQDLLYSRRVAGLQPASQDGAALSKREKPSKRVPRVARRWDTPLIGNQPFDPYQTFEGVRSKIVTTPAGELVLWGNRQTTLILQQARAMLGNPDPFRGLALPRKGVDKIFPIILRVAHGHELRGGDARGLFKLAENLADLSASNEGGIVAYIDADDTRTNAEVRISEMHESVHVAQFRIGRGTINIVSAAWMRGDPDYRQITQSEIGQAYARQPTILAAESAAYILSGQGNRAGYNGVDSLERAVGFANRYLSEVARLYGVEAVKQFRDIHPEMSVSVERIVTHGNSTQRAGSRNRGRTQGRDGGGFAAIDGARSIGDQERQSVGEWLRAWWGRGGEERAPRSPARDREAEKSSWAIKLPYIETSKQLDLNLPGDISQSSPGGQKPQETPTALLKGAENDVHHAADISRAAQDAALPAPSIGDSSQFNKAINGYHQDWRRDDVGSEKGGISMTSPDLDRWDIINRMRAIENSASVTEADGAEWARLKTELTEWQEYWDGNEIESNLGDRLTPEEIEMAYGGQSPEDISERLRLEFGSALAEAEGIARHGSPRRAVEGFASVPRPLFVEEAEVEVKSSQPATTTISRETLRVQAALTDSVSLYDKAVNAPLIKSLREIATIEATDPDGARYTWRDIAAISAGIAREALASHENQPRSPEVSSGRPSLVAGAVSKGGENRIIETLQAIANIESLDPSRHSWKDRATVAIETAREALGAIQSELTARGEENRVERRNRGPGHALGL